MTLFIMLAEPYDSSENKKNERTKSARPVIVHLVPTPSSYLNYNFAASVFNNVIIKIQASSEIIHDIILLDVLSRGKNFV